MDKIPWQRWVKVCVVLVLLGLAADYYFLHILFHQKVAPIEAPKENQGETPAGASDVNSERPPNDAATSPNPTTPAPEARGTASTGANFLESLKACRPDISSQGVTTPEALLTYLEKSIGQESGQQGGNSFVAIAKNQENINKSVLVLKDQSVLTLDDRGGQVLGFELVTEGKKLICRGTECSCQ